MEKTKHINEKKAEILDQIEFVTKYNFHGAGSGAIDIISDLPKKHTKNIIDSEFYKAGLNPSTLHVYRNDNAPAWLKQ